MDDARLLRHFAEKTKPFHYTGIQPPEQRLDDGISPVGGGPVKRKEPMKRVIFTMSTLMLIAACGDGSTSTVQLSFNGLEDLGSDYVYEGWLIVDGAPVSSGRFSVDSMGALSPASFEVPMSDADEASNFVLTIEPFNDPDPAPAATHVLAGAINAGAATLSIGDAMALNTDFSNAVGSYILNTPTTASNSVDYDQGVWWLDPGTSTKTLTLDTLPAGWEYEGWIVTDSGPVTTGRFTALDAADKDGAGPTAGPDGFPGFPGQDYIDPAIVLTTRAVVISVEPQPDNSPDPFTLKPLIDADAMDFGLGGAQDMANVIGDHTISGMMTLQ